MNATPTPERGLKRSLTLPLVTLYGLGTILGAGIYVLIGEVTARSGLFAPFAFLLASITAGLTAFSYAELSARMPRSAGEAVYVNAAFGQPWLATIIGWAVAIVGLISAATIANGFVGYFSLYFNAPAWIVITALILLLGVIAAWGISESVWLATIITVIELAGLLLVIVVAGDSLGELPVRLPELTPEFSFPVWQGIFFGAFLAFYAFVGFEDMVNLAEEVRDPVHVMPKAIVLALLLATLLYFLVALIAVMSLPLEELNASTAPLATIVESRGINAYWTIGLIGMVAVVNGALIQIIMAARVLYGMACDKLAPAIFMNISARTRTPMAATVLVTVVVLGLALWLPLVRLAELTSLLTLGIFVFVNLALLRIKWKTPRSDTIHVPMWVPILGVISCLLMMLGA